jgi:hypothetical protein
MTEETEVQISESLIDLYMENRRGMLQCPDEYTYYRRLMESISIGYSILGDSSKIAEEARKALENKENYTKSRNMDFHRANQVYSCSTGDDSTGKITVRPEELSLGESSLRNQQANQIVQRLAPIDRRIFQELIEGGWIKKLTLLDTMERNIIKEYMEDTDDESA